MSLPTGNEKEYLEVTPAPGGFVIQAEEGHSAELQALYRQYGIPLQVHPDVGPGRDELVFTQGVDVGQVRGMLEAYKNPKGS